MRNKISKPTQREILEALRQRYRQATKPDKAKILDEFIAVAGWHRKHAIRLLAGSKAATADAPPVSRGLTMRPCSVVQGPGCCRRAHGSVTFSDEATREI